MTPNGSRPPRVLHIVESLDRNAVESWLLRMLAHARANDVPVDWTFYTHLPEPGADAPRATELGARVVRTPVPLSDKRDFAIALRREIIRGGYDVIHAHHDILNGYYFAASAGCGVARRICHIHNADENVPVNGEKKRAVVRAALRGVATHMADRIVGISNHTLDRFIQWRPRRAGRDVVHYYGLDASRFVDMEKPPEAFRAERGIPPEAPIVLYGGRLVVEKNPLLAMDVFAAMKAYAPQLHFVVAGTGALAVAMGERARAQGLVDSVHLLGWRGDLPRIMRCSDLFLLARPEEPPEGFGLAVVEAQLAGLRCLLSRGIPDDTLLPSAVAERVGTSEPVENWARKGLNLLARPAPCVEVALRELAASPMNMDTALAHLTAIHEGRA